MNKKTKETGLELGKVINKTIPIQETLINISGNSAMIFISLYCTFCNDLLPHLKNISEKYNLKLVLFSDGDNEENNEMIDYFEWKFPVHSISQEEMNEYFEVQILPFTLIVNEKYQVTGKGTIYDEQMFELIYKNLKTDLKETLQ